MDGLSTLVVTSFEVSTNQMLILIKANLKMYDAIFSTNFTDFVKDFLIMQIS